MTAEVTLRVATPADGRAVGALLRASYPVLMRAGYDEAVLKGALPLMTRANPTLLSSGTYYVAETGSGLMVGCGGWTRERPGTGEVLPQLGHIRHFATHPDWIGRGIGRAIHDRCEEAARSAGVTRFECYASRNAAGFYAALGFSALREIAVPMGPDLAFPSVLMARTI